MTGTLLQESIDVIQTALNLYAERIIDPSAEERQQESADIEAALSYLRAYLNDETRHRVTLGEAIKACDDMPQLAHALQSHLDASDLRELSDWISHW